MQPAKPAPTKPAVRGFDSSQLFREDCLVPLKELYKELARLEESMRKLKASIGAREEQMKRMDEILGRHTTLRR